MASRRHPVVLPPMPAIDFLTYILQQHTAPTTLIVCSTRESFLAELSAAVNEPPPANPAANGSPSPSPEPIPPIHPLLIPTIHFISTARTIALAFTPTLPHLRAYLATYIPPPMPTEPQPQLSKLGTQTPMLAMWNPLALHSPTTDFSAQGLSRTFAAAVEAAERAGMQLVIEETEAGHGEEGGEEIHGEEGEENVQGGNEESGGEELRRDPWRQQVPFLNGSVRIGGGERLWAGRMVEVGTVVRKWCRFVSLDDCLHEIEADK